MLAHSPVVLLAAKRQIYINTPKMPEHTLPAGLVGEYVEIHCKVHFVVAQQVSWEDAAFQYVFYFLHKYLKNGA